MKRPKPTDKSIQFISKSLFDKIESKFNTYPKPKYNAKLKLWLEYLKPLPESIADRFSTGTVQEEGGKKIYLGPPLTVRSNGKEITVAPQNDREVEAFHKFWSKHYPKRQPKGKKSETVEAQFKIAHRIEKIMFNEKASLNKSVILFAEGRKSNERKAGHAIALVKEFRMRHWVRTFNVSEEEAKVLVNQRFGKFEPCRKKPGEYFSSQIEFEETTEPWNNQNYLFEKPPTGKPCA